MMLTGIKMITGVDEVLRRLFQRLQRFQVNIEKDPHWAVTFLDESSQANHFITLAVVKNDLLEAGDLPQRAVKDKLLQAHVAPGLRPARIPESLLGIVHILQHVSMFSHDLIEVLSLYTVNAVQYYQHHACKQHEQSKKNQRHRNLT